MTKTAARVRHTEMTETINYLRRCADNKVLEASLTPEMCLGLVQMIDHLEAERDAAQAKFELAREALYTIDRMLGHDDADYKMRWVICDALAAKGE